MARERTPEEMLRQKEFRSNFGAELVDVGAGALAGAAAGLMVGPVGVAAGAIVGATVGAIASIGIATAEHEKADHEKELDRIGSVPPPPPSWFR
jgi:uncharacterized membrane protein